MSRVCLIVNPRSANGRTAQRLDELEALAQASFDEVAIRLTKARDHATALTAQAATEGFDLLICVGGDGTVNEVVNGLFDGRVPRAPAMALAVVPAGTGGDLVRTLGMPRTWREALPAIASGKEHVVDVIEGVMQGHDGNEVRRLCINCAGWGLNGAVVARVNRSSKALGGRATFFGATIASTLSFRPQDVHVRWTDAAGAEQRWTGPLMSGFAANGQYVGGGMWIARDGAMDDGCLDMVLLPPRSTVRTILSSRRLYDGSVREMSDVCHDKVRWLRAECTGDSPVLVDFDGEQPGMLPLELTVLPSVLRIRAPWGAS